MRFIGVFLFFLLPAVLVGQGRVEELLLGAGNDMRTEKYDAALQKVSDVLALEPNNLTAHQLRITALYFSNMIKEAGQALSAALSRHPSEPELWYLNGLVLIEQGRYRRAVEEFNRVIQVPSYAELHKVYLKRGTAAYHMTDYEMALTDYAKSIELLSENAPAYHSRGILNYQIRDYESAVEDFNRALAFNPENAETYFNLGMSFFRIGRLSEACYNLHQGCKRKSTNACKMALMECSRD